MTIVNYDELDPGIREVVKMLNDHGFETSDSGDGVSKPKEWFESGEAIPFPHVILPVPKEQMIVMAHGVQELLGAGWTVEASYQTHTESAILFARTLDPRELGDGATL